MILINFLEYKNSNVNIREAFLRLTVSYKTDI